MNLKLIVERSKINFKSIINNFETKKLSQSILESISIPCYSKHSSQNIDISESLYGKISINDPRVEIISRFTPPNILCDIMTNYTNFKKYEFKYKNHKTIISILSKEKIDYNLITKLGLKSLLFCNEKFNNSNINLLFIPHPDKKELLHFETIGPESVNSAFTTHYFNGNKNITIFREEEAEKVLIHELVHYLNIDYANINSQLDDINKKFMEDFDVTTSISNINTFEAYTDFIGILYNNIYNSILENRNIYEMMDNEKRFQKYQVNKLLSKYKMRHPIKIKNNGNMIKQNTNVVSYYILKYGLTMDYENTLKDYNINTNWDKNKIHEFYNYVLDNLKSEEFNPRSLYNESTMRMSYF